MIKILIFLYTSLLLSCNSNTFDSKKVNKNHSIQVVNAFNCYLDNKHGSFINFANNRSQILDIHVEKIYYSPDSTKMFAITLLEDNESYNECIYNDSSTFYFYPFVGYRNDIQSEWKILFYKNLLLLDGCNKEEMNKYIESKFVEEFSKTKIDYFLNNEFIEKEVGYNINEDGFWESPFWEKGGLIEDKYYFEVEITSYVSKIFKPIDEIKCESSP